MRRPGRLSAGAEVVARAQRLSDDLLRDEHDTFARIERMMLQQAVRVEALIRDSPSLNGLTPERLGQIRTILAQSLDLSVPLVGILCGDAAKMAVDAVGDELMICESTLSKKYMGVAKNGWLAAVEATDGSVDASVGVYADQMPQVLEQTMAAVQHQIGLVLLYEEGKVGLVERLLLPSPVNRKGLSGKGVWWGAASGCQMRARAVEIDLVNGLRALAMKTMNEAAAGV